MEQNQEEKKQNLFEQLWSKGKDAVKSIEKPFTRKEMKAGLESAARDTYKQEFEAQRKLHDEYAKFADMDVNTCIKHKETIRKAQASRAHIESIWSEVFGSTMPNVMEED